jgi:hypothetical protein
MMVIKARLAIIRQADSSRAYIVSAESLIGPIIRGIIVVIEASFVAVDNCTKPMAGD